MSEVFVIAQGGGPTAVINQTIAGAALEARRRFPGSRVLGARFGIRGVRDNDFVDLSAMTEAEILRIGATPGATLGSTRDKPDGDYCGLIVDGLRRASATAFIYIGGNDTAGTQQILAEADDRIAFIHAPKTIDNDLVGNDHTPGFISAAWFVASAFRSIDLDVRAMPGIYVGIVMGRHAGFLTASGATWRRDESDGPHILCLPEHPFSLDGFLAAIDETRSRFGRCVVAMSEGVADAEGRPLVESLLGERAERDAHGNLRLGGGDLGVAMQEAIARAFPKVRARVDTFGYLPRGFATMIAEADSREAFEAGAFAVAIVRDGAASVALGHDGEKTVFERVPLADVAGKTRLMPDEFSEPERSSLSAGGRAYFSRLLPAPPEIAPPLV